MPEQPTPSEPFVLTRESLLRDDLGARISRTLPDFVPTTPEQRQASIRDILSQRPQTSDGLWVFGYGSLIWNPAFHYVASRTTRVRGWHRAFCLAARAGRGTPDTPGMMLGLLPGGTCDGVAFQVAEDQVESELKIVWTREMVGDGYVPRWVALERTDGAADGWAIAFTVNPNGRNYDADVTQAELVRRLATASGYLGTACEYLFRTESHLEALGIHDPCVAGMAALVRAAQAAHDRQSGA